MDLPAPLVMIQPPSPHPEASIEQFTPARLRVRAIVVNGSDVYAGGEFNLAGNGDGDGNVAVYRFLDSKPSLLK